MFSGLSLLYSSLLLLLLLQLVEMPTSITTLTTTTLRRMLTCSTSQTPGQLTTRGYQVWLLEKSSRVPERNCLNIPGCTRDQSTLRRTSSQTLTGYFSRIFSEFPEISLSFWFILVVRSVCWCVDVTIMSSASLTSAKPMLCFKSADQNNLAFTSVYVDRVGQ